MRTLFDIDFLADEALRRRLAALSLALLAAGAALVALLVAAGVLPSACEAALLLGRGVLPWAAALVALTLVSMPVHELVHGALFRLLGGPGTRVRYGHAAGMLYAGCPGLVLSRARFCMVLLGPAALLSALLLVLPCVLGYPLLGAIACVFHLSSCAGDVLAAALALREPSCTHVQDTEEGVRLLTAERG